jgi:serine protease
MTATLTIPHVEPWKVLVAGIAVLVTGCGGGGGGGSTAAPTVQLGATPTNVVVGGTSTLTWSSTNADTCQASDGWNGVRPPSGSETTGTINTATRFTLQCAGAGGSATASATVTIAAGDSSVAGHLLVPTISRSDSDVNDPNALFAPNNTMAQAQVMPNPVVIGGFVNFVGFGEDDSRFLEDVDTDDFYRVDLLAGQVIELVIPTASGLPGGDDADLFLVDLNGNDVASSEGQGQVETIFVDTPGTYFINVFAFDGAPMYRLSVGQSTVVQNTPSLRLNDEFVPGELIVTLKDSVKTSGDAAATASTNAATLAERFGLSRKGGAPDREMLLKLPDDVTAVTSGTTPGSRANADTKTANTTATATGAAKSPAPRRRQAASALQQRKLDTIRYAKLLRRDPAVRSADLNRIMRTSRTPDDADYAIQRWHYEQIQLPFAWDVTTGSTAVRVAVVDTGIVTTHPELSSKLVQGYDFVSSTTNGDGDGIDPNPADPGCVIGGGSIFHGTHVAGTIGARSDDPSNVPGVAGVSWGARIMPIRALDGCKGEGEAFDIIQGIRFAAGLSNNSGTTPQPADVINLSFGAAGACDQGVADLFLQVRAQGVAVVAAAGNDNTDALQSPASCDNVISVAATGPLRTKAPYSNFGPTVHLAAPGGDERLDIDGNGLKDGVYSTHAVGGGATITPTLDLLQGTSMSAPHVAGVIALMLSVNSDMTPAQIDQLLAQGALTDPILGENRLGQGLINASKAVFAANPNLPQPPPRISVTPSSLAFGDIGTMAQVVVVNAGGPTLDVTGFSPSEPWLSVVETAVDGNGQGVYTISVDRTGLLPGSYSAFVLFTSNGGTGRVDVLMEVADANAVGEPSAGTQYVLLTDPETGDELPQQDRVDAEGRSPVGYQIDGVAAGQYVIVSGTDLNNDDFICDPAEACGAYPVESAPVPITVDGAETGFDFVVSYRTGVPSSASSTDTKGVRKEVRRRRLVK